MRKFIAGMALAIVVVAGAWGAFLPMPEKAGQNVAAVAAALAAIVPTSGDDVTMATHKAIYDFRMVGLGSGGGLTDIRGSMFYEQGDACDAWTTDHRFTSEYFYPERPSVLNVSQYVAWEAKDGSLFQFNSEREESGAESEQLRGAVDRREDGAATAVYSRPSDLKFDLAKGYYLPTQHTSEIIRRAKKGEKIFHGILFDGTDADGPVEVNAVITRAATADEIDAIAARAPQKISATLLTPQAWHVRMAVFALKPGETDDNGTPSYEMDMILHDNGIISDAVIDYQKFKVAQRLIALEPLPAVECSETP